MNNRNQCHNCTCRDDHERLIPDAEMHPATNIMGRRWVSTDGTRRGVFRGYPEQLPPRGELLWGDMQNDRMTPEQLDEWQRLLDEERQPYAFVWCLIAAVVAGLGLIVWRVW